jgi:4-amino-4-deoxy-L-arabinose transferase-like glycosyltransferase
VSIFQLKPVTIIGFSTFVTVVFLALFARFYKLGSVPLGLYWDEVSILAEAKTIARQGTDIHANSWLQPIFPAYGDYKLPVYIWVSSVFVKILGASDIAVRLPNTAAGIGTVIMTALIVFEIYSLKKQRLGRTKTQEKNLKIFDREVLPLVICAGLVILISPWSIHFSRTGFEGHLAQFFLAVAMWLSLKKTAWLKYAASTLVAVLATYTYFSVRYVWPVIFLSVMLLYVVYPGLRILTAGSRSKLNILKLLKPILMIVLSLGLFFICLTPLLRSEYYPAMQQLRFSTNSVFNIQNHALKSNQLRELADNGTISRIFYHRHWLLIREVLKNYSDNLSWEYLFISGDPNLRHGTGYHGLFLLPLLPVLLIGIYKLARTNLRGLLILIIWWLTALLPASVADTTPHALRSLNALVPTAAILAFGLWAVYEKIVKSWFQGELHMFMKTGSLWLSGLILVIFLGGYTHYYFVNYPQRSASNWQYGFKPIALQVCSLRSGRDKIWVDVGDDRFFLWLLAYCDFNFEELSQAEFEKFSLKKIDNIEMNGLSESMTEEDFKDSVLVSNRSQEGVFTRFEFLELEKTVTFAQNKYYFYKHHSQ